MVKEKICGIYKITNLINGKIYIGQALDIYRRWGKHKGNAFNKNSREYDYPIYRAIRKYGLENFSFEIIEECSVEELDEKEIYYIKKYNSCTLWKNSHGYNQTIGGNGTKGVTPKSAYKVFCEDKVFETVTKCAEYYVINSGTMKGWVSGNDKMPQEWYNKGLRREDKTMEDYEIAKKIGKRKIICVGIEFESIKECADYYKISRTVVEKWLSKKLDIPQNFYDMQLHYSDTEFEECNYQVQKGRKKGRDNYNSKVVICEGKEFGSASECANYYKIKIGTMNSWLNHKNKMPKIFYDRGLHYADEPMESYEYTTKTKMIICDGKIFDSITDCANYYKIKIFTMSKWLIGKNPTPQNFIDMGLAYYTE